MSLLAAALRHPARVGALCPTSPNAARALASPILRRHRLVVELGAGTGSVTEHVLERVGPRTRVVLFELDPVLRRRLARQFGRRVEVEGDAAFAGNFARGADVVVCAIPFASLPAEDADRILATARRLLAADGVMTAIQYTDRMLPAFREHFRSVRRGPLLTNMPPARVYRCRAR